MKETQDLDANT